MATKRKTAKALAGSIAKWHAVSEGIMADDGTDNCPLCALFLVSKNCGHCPVAAAGHQLCGSGPYSHWLIHHHKKHSRGWPREIECGTCTHLAKAELKFLEGLTP